VLQKEAEAKSKEMENTMVMKEEQGAGGSGRGRVGERMKKEVAIVKSDELQEAEGALADREQEWQQVCDMLSNTEELLERAVEEGKSECASTRVC